jgi:hypothetical protein
MNNVLLGKLPVSANASSARILESLPAAPDVQEELIAECRSIVRRAKEDASEHKLAARVLTLLWPRSSRVIRELLLSRSSSNDGKFMLLCWLSDVWDQDLRNKRDAIGLVIEYLSKPARGGFVTMMACDLIVDHMPLSSAIACMRACVRTANRDVLDALLSEINYHGPVANQRAAKLLAVYAEELIARQHG